ncbi:MAG TPA: helix-turn-helix domain-containing protein [Paracoccus sp. (in: a-proteobacteria)]|jgi:excisionase family DNA binding protein|uniref:helix-turn-helix domain-containing protein n=1 Tax=uncultured Paracoccus sp. TaxID=189685 RepID=UPI00260E29E8|nr:helix-turn-helix domain-containing protein [uncultured Paracoccus sp.]HMQ40249.1 helix-turn-helix domain-containing protein [Paracoccus sp. (in: a-proteobacteria)]HMR35219.1 helix-turn-helix domain-containing protein [Paracoccus sp. (in: a-proteobacteria)]
MQNNLETPKELAQRLGWPERRVRSLITAKQLRHVKIGGMYFVPQGAFDEFLNANMVEPDQPQGGRG